VEPDALRRENPRRASVQAPQDAGARAMPQSRRIVHRPENSRRAASNCGEQSKAGQEPGEEKAKVYQKAKVIP
jgi:hypothetical protein